MPVDISIRNFLIVFRLLAGTGSMRSNFLIPKLKGLARNTIGETFKLMEL